MSCVAVRWPGFWNNVNESKQKQDNDDPEREITEIGVHPVSSAPSASGDALNE